MEAAYHPINYFLGLVFSVHQLFITAAKYLTTSTFGDSKIHPQVGPLDWTCIDVPVVVLWW